jgi:hypothetical protein
MPEVQAMDREQGSAPAVDRIQNADLPRHHEDGLLHQGLFQLG